MTAFSTITRRIPRPLRRLYRTFFPHPAPQFAALWQASCTKWMIGDCTRDGAAFCLTGWLVVAPELREFVEFRIRGRSVDQVWFPLPRPDVAADLPFVPGAEQSGFAIWQNEPEEVVDLSVAVIDRRTGQPWGWEYPPYFVPSATRFGPNPSANRIARVIGDSSDFNFRFGGETAFRRLQAEVLAATGQDLAAYPRVLDWGCGCARVSRYFLELPGVTVHGVDVDADNVRWCQENYPAAKWSVVPLRPPTELADASFDLAFGISVFTHLKEPDQLLWLDELTRMLRPGGIALMTFHGPASLVWSRLSGERYAALGRTGICDQANPIYDAELAEADYYRDTFHTEEYVRRVWGRFFEILAVVPCAVAHQDLVVMMR